MMIDEQEDKHTDHEESEYHFTDDDISYDAEAEGEPEAPKPSSSEKINALASLTKSKRMLLSLVVFLALVFVVYKMVSPGASVPSTDFSTTAANNPARTPAPMSAQPTNPAAPGQPEVVTMVQAVPPTSAAPPNPVQNQPSPPPAESVAQQSTTNRVAEMPQVIPVQSVTPSYPQANPQANAQPPAPAPMNPPSPQANAAYPTGPQQPPMTGQAVVTQPGPPPMSQPGMPPQAPVAMNGSPASPATADSINAALASMASTNERLMNQLQTEYSQKLNEFSNQNRAIQDQMQVLSSRVTTLETQINQLVQTLTHQNQPPAPIMNAPPGPPGPPSSQVDIKVEYSVQAIIPGRAWLKSDSGETLTVAEGDTIRDLGRVSKIDPYDGIVEINTGNRVVSLSYGNGG